MADELLAGFVRRLRLHASLDASDARALLDLPYSKMTRDHYASVAREGDKAEYLFILLSGLVERHRLESGGGKQILAFYIAGDPLNLDHLFLEMADDDLRTIKRSEIACIRLADMRELIAKRPGIALAVGKTMTVDASIFREWIVNIGQRDSKARIAHLLCELDFRLEQQACACGERRLPLTQYNIAEATGLTAVHVNRSLKALQTKGVLTTGAGGILLHDREALQDIAGFDFRYLHMVPYEQYS